MNHKEMASLQDPKQLTLGYTEAARSWYWLIDPDEWESTRTKEIRLELARLLGRDFSSYAELKEWWERNNQHLFWSGTDERLEVREPSVQDLANPYAYHLKHPIALGSAVEYIRQQPHALDPESATGKIEDGTFRGSWGASNGRHKGLPNLERLARELPIVRPCQTKKDADCSAPTTPLTPRRRRNLCPSTGPAPGEFPSYGCFPIRLRR